MSEIEKINFYEAPACACENNDRPAEEIAAAVEEIELYGPMDDEEEPKSKIGEKFDAVVEGLGDTMEDIKDKVEDVVDVAKEKVGDTVDVAKEKLGDVKDKLNSAAGKAADKLDAVINDPDNRQALEDGVAKVKAAVSKPVDVSLKRDGSTQVPAGVLGAVAAAALYPLHKNKVIGAAALGTLGYWAVNKLGGIEGSKEFVKETAQNLKETFNKGEVSAEEVESIVLKP